MSKQFEVDFVDGDEFIDSAKMTKQVIFIDEFANKLWYSLPGWQEMPVIFQYRAMNDEHALKALLERRVADIIAVWRASFELVEQ